MAVSDLWKASIALGSFSSSFILFQIKFTFPTLPCKASYMFWSLSTFLIIVCAILGTSYSHTDLQTHQAWSNTMTVHCYTLGLKCSSQPLQHSTPLSVFRFQSKYKVNVISLGHCNSFLFKSVSHPPHYSPFWFPVCFILRFFLLAITCLFIIYCKSPTLLYIPAQYTQLWAQ